RDPFPSPPPLFRFMRKRTRSAPCSELEFSTLLKSSAADGQIGTPGSGPHAAQFKPLNRSLDQTFTRSKPIKQAGEIGTHFASVSISCERLPFVSISFERSSPVQKMDLGSERIRHSQIHLPSVSAKYRIRQDIEIAVQNAVD